MSIFVILLRHGDYSAKTGNLNQTGIDQARSAAERMLDLLPDIDIILYSPLPRAKETFTIVSGTFRKAGKIISKTQTRESPPLQTEDEIYGTQPGDILYALESLENEDTEPKTVLVISHRPEIIKILNMLFPRQQEEFPVGRGQAIVVEGVDSDGFSGLIDRQLQGKRRNWLLNAARPGG